MYIYLLYYLHDMVRIKRNSKELKNIASILKNSQKVPL